MRGDVPRFRLIQSTVCAVFPACAGMFLTTTCRRHTRIRFPRMRGDVPGDPWAALSRHQFSPHARGCSAVAGVTKAAAQVFPACAGMFLFTPHLCCPPHGFPRMRGDVPCTKSCNGSMIRFSPHARGCSALDVLFHVVMHVFPACAGMFLVYF